MEDQDKRVHSKKAKERVFGEVERRDLPVVISELETKPRGRPVCLGEQLDSLVQEFLINLRAAGGVVNTTVVMGLQKESFLS